MNSNNKINALINLLDDPDQQVYTVVKSELLDIGNDVVPILENAWDHSFDSTFQSRIENIIHQINFELLKEELTNWRNDQNRSLLYGAYLVTKFQYTDISYEPIEEYVSQLTQDIWIEINQNLTALEKVKVINHIFFNVHGFSGDKKHFHSPQNSYINNVIDVKKGNPVSLSLLYIEVASRLNVPVYGVNLPEHFVLAYTSLPIQYFDKLNKNDILFYINTFNRGSLFEEKEISLFLEQLNVEAQPQYFLPCDSIAIIKRILNNLTFSYSKLGYEEKTKELKELIACLGEDNKAIQV